MLRSSSHDFLDGGLIHAQVNWDLNGNLIQRKDLKLSPNVTEDFFYDALNRFDRSERTPAGGVTSTNADITLDAIGNITWKLGVGSYAYHATKKRAVVSAGSHTFGYDANGNMSSRNGASIGYTSYNLPTSINAGGYSSTLSYGAFRNRFKQVAIGPQGTETTIYVAGLLEKVTNGSGTHYRHYIQGGRGVAAIYTRTVGGSNTTHYLHRDHLGSPELITDNAGNEVVRPSFAAYGERRDGDNWDGAPPAGDFNLLTGITRRGFTGHEHLDAVELIHMNGRVYEPVIGRFLGMDPIRMLGISQDANSYAYAWNDPLNVIDPSGWCDEPERWTIYQSDDAPGGITDIVVTGSHVCPNKASSVSIASNVIVVGGSFGGAGTGAGVGGGRDGGSGGDEADDPGENASEPQEQSEPQVDKDDDSCKGPTLTAQAKVGFFAEYTAKLTNLLGLQIGADLLSVNVPVEGEIYLSRGGTIALEIGNIRLGASYEEVSNYKGPGRPPEYSWRPLPTNFVLASLSGSSNGIDLVLAPPQVGAGGSVTVNDFGNMVIPCAH